MNDGRRAYIHRSAFGGSGSLSIGMRLRVTIQEDTRNPGKWSVGKVVMEVPTMTDLPSVTGVPSATGVPSPTQAPSMTEMPIATEVSSEELQMIDRFGIHDSQEHLNGEEGVVTDWHDAN